MELDFRKKFKQYDVMEEIGVDPMLLGDVKQLRVVLEPKIKLLNDRNLKLDKMNEKQMIDKLIEHHIESKCKQPSLIMNHPLIMSPLAKTHAQGRDS